VRHFARSWRSLFSPDVGDDDGTVPDFELRAVVLTDPQTEVARQDGRPNEVGVEINTQPNKNDFVAIGFRPAPTPAAYAAPYWAFRAP
jgi:hypothetical protein